MEASLRALIQADARMLRAGVVRPTPAFARKPHAFASRLRAKRWTERFPGVRVVASP